MRSPDRLPQGTAAYATTCYVKVHETDPFEEQYRRNKGFLHFAPDLRKTPRLLVIRPDNVRAITKRLESGEDFVRKPSDRQALYTLRDKVYTSRKQPFHWDLRDIPETNPEYGVDKAPKMMSSSLDTADRYSDNDEDHDPHAHYEYPAGQFVAVVAIERGKTSFWVAKILDSCTNHEGVVNELRILWYEPKNSTNGPDPINATYIESTIGVRTQRPYIDHVRVSTVICTFQGLKRNGS